MGRVREAGENDIWTLEGGTRDSIQSGEAMSSPWKPGQPIIYADETIHPPRSQVCSTCNGGDSAIWDPKEKGYYCDDCQETGLAPITYDDLIGNIEQNPLRAFNSWKSQWGPNSSNFYFSPLVFGDGSFY